MADEDYGDDDAFYYDDDDYLYVEDDYAIADELAETQVPSPGYTGVYDEIAMEGFEYDVYEYFGELEYGSDSYWDARMKHLSEAGLGEKRKSEEEEDTEARLVKKRRKDGRGDVQEVRDNVLYVPFERRLAPLPPAIQPSERKFALLPDRKERFPERGSPVGTRKQMPAEMRKAAEEVIGEEDDDEEDENGPADREDGDEVEMGEDGEFEDDDDEDGEEEEEDAGGLDQDLVMQVLRQKLADSGLGDVDESMFKDVIAKMMSGDGDSEDAVGGLASLLLGQEGGGGKAFEGFLAGQGVQLGGADGDDEDKSEAESQDDDNEANSRPTKKAKANPTRKKSQKPSTTASSSTARPKPTSKTPTTSRTRSNLSETTALHESPSATRTSPTVVPSPLPPAIAAAAAASSTRPSRKRRAPSLEESSMDQIATATTSSAKPPAKRRRATPASSRSETPVDDPEPGTTRRRTTRSAAAAAGPTKGRG